MELRNKKLNYLLSTICKENEDFANTLQEAESNMSNKLIRLIEDCKTFEIETPDYIACLKINRAFNLWVKFKDTNRDLFLLI